MDHVIPYLDGGKTWIVDGESQGPTATVVETTADAMYKIKHAMRPGVRVSQLLALGRQVFRRVDSLSPESILF